MLHIPVLKDEILKYLDPKANENFIDGTVGQGGHAKIILERTSPNGKVLGLDLDPKQIENCKNELFGFKERIVLANASYSNIKKITEDLNFGPLHGILLDLGMSSWQLESSGKGFSFQKDEALDMRYDGKNNLTAEGIINKWPQEKIEQIIKEFGEERFAKKIAREISEQRKVKTIKRTSELVDIIKRAVPARYQKGKIHFATRTFQALRIAVNEELENLTKVLPDAFSILPAKGRIAVISFHSLEDRIVKNFFKNKKNEKQAILLTNKPVIASDKEIKINPCSRSAKMRVLQKI